MRGVILISLMFLMVGCTTTRHLSVWSYDEDVVKRYMAQNPGAKTEEGKDCESMYFVVPTGIADPFQALELLQQKFPGKAFVGGEFKLWFWQVPPFYARMCATAEGVPVTL